MAVHHEVLGLPGRDNALTVVIDTGQAVHRLLFDCGDGCLRALSLTEMQEVSHLFLSHFHMDHVAGFDRFFRANYNRPREPVHVWGPPRTIELMHHRFRSYLWNLHTDQPGRWQVHEIDGTTHREAGFVTAEAFTHAREEPGGTMQLPGPILVVPGVFQVEAMLLDHNTPCAAYRVQEHERTNVDTVVLEEKGWQPGPWLALVKDMDRSPDEPVDVEGGKTMKLGELRDMLLTRTEGRSVAYLTDFRLEDEKTRDSLVRWLYGVDVMVCEAQYRHEDLELAEKNAHMTTRLVGELARDSNAGRLVLQHLSRRYPAPVWIEMRDEAAAVFPRTEFPGHWRFGKSRH